MLIGNRPLLAWIVGLYLSFAGAYSVYEHAFWGSATRTTSIFPIEFVIGLLTVFAGIALLAKLRTSIIALALIAISITAMTAITMFNSQAIDSIGAAFIYIAISILACYLVLGYSIYLDKTGYFKK